MPKIATKFIADVTLKVGRRSMSVKMPVNLADASADFDDWVNRLAEQRVGGSLKIIVANVGSLKKAYKAYKKVHP